MKEHAKKSKDNVIDEVSEAVESGGILAQFLDFIGVIGRGLEVGFSIVDKIFKPLELVTNAISVLRNLLDRSSLNRVSDSEVYEQKKRKKDALALFGVVGFGLGVGVITSTGVGALALIASGYVVTASKLFYLHRQTAKKIKASEHEQKAKGQNILQLLKKDKPTKEDLYELSAYVNEYLEKYHQVEHKKEKQKERIFDMGSTILVTVAFVVAAVVAAAFPPLLIPMGFIGLGIVMLGPAKKLFNWASKKYPRIFSFGRKSKEKASAQDKAKTEKYEILNEMLASASSSVSSSVSGTSAPVSFSSAANDMLHRYEAQRAAQKMAEEKVRAEARAMVEAKETLQANQEEMRRQLVALQEELIRAVEAVNSSSKVEKSSLEALRSALRERESVESRVTSEAQLLGMGREQFKNIFSDPNHADFLRYQPLIQEYSNALRKEAQTRAQNEVDNLDLSEKRKRQVPLEESYVSLEESCRLLDAQIENSDRNLARSLGVNAHGAGPIRNLGLEDVQPQREHSPEEARIYNDSHLMGIPPHVSAIEASESNSHLSMVRGLDIFEHHDTSHPFYEKPKVSDEGDGESEGQSGLSA